ncbi:MAG: hypothetical protein EGR80_09735, partial [Ruminiclostridium sp.]|nr:hypothetical protein [Ruminiclostridium sp.]
MYSDPCQSNISVYSSDKVWACASCQFPAYPKY